MRKLKYVNFVDDYDDYGTEIDEAARAECEPFLKILKEQEFALTLYVNDKKTVKTEVTDIENMYTNLYRLKYFAGHIFKKMKDVIDFTHEQTAWVFVKALCETFAKVFDCDSDAIIFCIVKSAFDESILNRQCSDITEFLKEKKL